MTQNPHKIIPELVLNWDLAADMLIRFISTEVKRAGFSKVVVGLSGGVDSALSAALAVKALGKGNVLPLKMPYTSSAPGSSEDAETFAEEFGLSIRTIEISPVVDELFKLIPDMGVVRRGNVMARTRMMLLFDAAAEHSALVLGTGNKTEIMLGYTTWYGDSACSLNPVGDLYKTQVWALAAHLNLPERIVSKVPSADLWVGQTDEGELGLTYEIADSILFHLIDKRLSVEDTVAAGFDPKTVSKIAERIKRFQFKRVMPPVAKISPRTIGMDFLYSRDWGT